MMKIADEAIFLLLDEAPEKAMQEAAAELLAMPAPRPGEKRVVQ